MRMSPLRTDDGQGSPKHRYTLDLQCMHYVLYMQTSGRNLVDVLGRTIVMPVNVEHTDIKILLPVNVPII